MTATPWHRRFYESTRGRLVGLLRREPRTIEELAREVGVTNNAVRGHLAVLERDGLVAQTGLRRGGGKPAYVYELTADAERLFPKAMGAVLAELLHVLSEQLDGAELEAALRDTGRRLAANRGGRRDVALLHRVRAAVQALVDLGGSAQFEKHDGRYTVQGLDCPFQEVVTEHPQVCFLAEALVEEMVAADVRQRCQRKPTPRCLFEILADGRQPAGPSRTARRRSSGSSVRRKRTSGPPSA